MRGGKHRPVEHLTDRQLGQHLDDELSAGERSAVERHLRRCARCRGELARLRRASRRLSRLLARAGSPPSPRPGGGGAPPPPPEPPSPLRFPSAARRGGRRAVAAAVAALLVAASVLPGSPLRSWTEAALHRARAIFASEGFDRNGPDEELGLEIPAADGRAVIRIVDAPPGTEIVVRLVEGSQAGAWAPGARLRSGPGEIEVMEPSAGSVRVALPRGASEARVEVDGQPMFVIAAGRVRSLGPGVDSAGPVYRWRIPGSSSSVPR